VKLPVAATLALLGVSGSAACPPEALVRRVVVQGIGIRYLDSGATVEPGPLLLMVHGWDGSARPLGSHDVPADALILLGALPPGN